MSEPRQPWEEADLVEWVDDLPQGYHVSEHRKELPWEGFPAVPLTDLQVSESMSSLGIERNEAMTMRSNQ